MIIDLPWPPAILGPNARPHWREKNRAAKTYMTACFYTMAQARPPKTKRFTVEFCPPCSRKYDRDNCIARFKSGQDAMAHYWRMDDNEFEVTYKPMGAPVKGGKVVICLD